MIARRKLIEVSLPLGRHAPARGGWRHVRRPTRDRPRPTGTGARVLGEHARSGAGPVASEGSSATGSTRAAGRGGVPSTPSPESLRNASYTARFALDAGDIEGAFTQIAEVIAHLLEAGPDLLDVSVTIRAEHGSGFDDSVTRAVSENARTLGADGSHFGQG